MIYELRHIDEPLLKFSAEKESNDPRIKILWVSDKQNLLPLDLTLSHEGLFRWLKRRTLPSNRAFVRNLLSKCGLNLNRPFAIISVSKGLSLNDCYWIVEEGFSGTFDQYNLYDNPLSRILANIAFTGYGSNIRASLASSPEFTTNGMLPKCWRRINKKIYLYKGGTTGASNTGMEPFSEFYAYQVAEAMHINAVPYEIHKWKNTLCSSCELFTSKDYSFIPVGGLVKEGGFAAVQDYYKTLGEPYQKALGDMLVLDALICNTDRHFGNFGFLVDNSKNQIAAPAPLFDHGNSLFNFAGRDDLESYDKFLRYANTLLPCVYDDFFKEAKRVLTKEHRDHLRGLLTFHFTKHSTYNLPDMRLHFLEQQIQQRAKDLLT